jgi:hypothetical protein
MKRIMLPVMALVFLSTVSAQLPAAKELSDTFVSVVEKVNCGCGYHYQRESVYSG